MFWRADALAAMFDPSYELDPHVPIPSHHNTMFHARLVARM